MRKQNKIILWPVYLDSTKTRTQGRRVPKGLAVPAPKLDELRRAVQKLDLRCEVVPDARHPNSPWHQTGMLVVAKNDVKTQIVRRVAKEMSTMRKETRSQSFPSRKV